MQGFTTILEELVAGHLTRCEMIKRDVKHTLGGVKLTIQYLTKAIVSYNKRHVT